MSSLHQKRLSVALRRIEEVTSLDDKKIKAEFKRYIRRLPSMIQANGLLGMAVFYASKGGTHEAIYEWVFSWLSESKRGKPLKDLSFKEIVKEYTSISAEKLSVATEEAILFASYLKRIAEALLEGDSEEETR